MNIRHFPPSSRLQPYISGYMIISSESGRINTVLPDTTLTLSFRLDGQVDHASTALSDTNIAGIRKGPQQMAYHDKTRILLVTLKPGAAAVFIPAPLHLLSSQVVAMADLFPPGTLHAISDRLQSATTDILRVQLLDKWLYSIIQPQQQDPLILAAIAHIRDAAGQLKIRDLATQLHISRDPLEKRFRSMVGTSPKHFAAIVRFRAVISRYHPNRSFTDLAYEAGYFDQAHFIRDFRLFTGQTPQAFFSHTPEW
ncbi:MAG: AraC family transcriptional regulator [Chitinophaga sp.]|uniref:helix-turn-helix domain-containing protein n=1 Tax=Chitinophaga sp. TaxID=1869181 RepID=UPI0025C0E476|nr:helix-turn-helix domain-containing protein [Chitinophaga sp.]MBV8253708.1 AraC family transcriptional regulator [Chitinophaga sp.]